MLSRSDSFKTILFFNEGKLLEQHPFDVVV